MRDFVVNIREIKVDCINVYQRRCINRARKQQALRLFYRDLYYFSAALHRASGYLSVLGRRFLVRMPLNAAERRADKSKCERDRLSDVPVRTGL